MVNGTRVLLNLMMEQAGYTFCEDEIVVALSNENFRQIDCIVKDRVDGNYMVTKWLLRRNDWATMISTEGSLEHCIEYMREKGLL